MIRIEKGSLSGALAGQLRKIASFPNPKFFERQRLRLSTARTPRIIKGYEEDENYLYLPRGVYEEVVTVSSQAGVRVEVTDERQTGTRLMLKFCGSLSPLQSEVAKAVLAHDQGSG